MRCWYESRDESWCFVGSRDMAHDHGLMVGALSIDDTGKLFCAMSGGNCPYLSSIARNYAVKHGDKHTRKERREGDMQWMKGNQGFEQ